MGILYGLLDLQKKADELCDLNEARYQKEKAKKELACDLLEELVKSIPLSVNQIKFRTLIKELRK